MSIAFTEGFHPADFVICEGNCHLSRDNVTVAESQTIKPGTIIVTGAGGYVAYAAGGAAPDPTTDIGIALYGATTAAGETAKISAIKREAEVNAGMIQWPAGITAPQKLAAAALLAANMVIVRGL
jgi:hypothetical protein